MAGYRFLLRTSVSIVLVLTFVPTGRTQSSLPAGFPDLTPFLKAVEPGGPTCKVYSLADLGDDPQMCKWIAETIPEMIQPASWKQSGAKLSYFAPSKILVINQTPAVHGQVDEFLSSLRKAAPQAKAARRDPQLLQTQFAVPDAIRPVGQTTASQAYPVPYPPAAPKHLFHFIIRYEGEGVIDSNVVKFAKSLSQANSPSCAPPTMSNSIPASYGTPAPPPPPPGPGTLSDGPIASPNLPAAGAPVPASLPPAGAPVPTGTSRPTMPPADAPAPQPSRTSLYR